MVASTELATRLGDRRWREFLSAYRRIVRGTLRRTGGREIDNAGDGFFAVFDQPASALECACAMTDALHAAGMDVRTGIHMGEIETAGDKMGGIAVHIGARVAAMAGPGQVLASSTIRDVASGSEYGFIDEGTHALKGVPGEWRIFRVDWPGARPLDHDALHGWEVRTPRRRRSVLFRPVTVVAALVVIAAVVGGVAFTLLRGSTPAAIVPGANTVAQIDGSTNAFTAATSVGTHPFGVAIGGGSIWVINYSDQTLTRIDPSTERLVSTRSVSGTPTGIVYGAQSVWVTAGFGLASGSGGAVLRYDGVTGNETRSIAVGDGVAGAAFGLGDLWVADRINDSVVEIDPTTNAIVATIPVGHGPEALAVGGSYVWVTNAVDHSLMRIDPVTHTHGAPVALDFAPNAIAADATGVWLAGATANRVAHIDSSGALITTVPVHAGPEGLAIVNGYVWVADGTARAVERINAAHAQVVGSLSVHGEPTAITAASDGSIWVTVSS